MTDHTMTQDEQQKLADRCAENARVVLLACEALQKAVSLKEAPLYAIGVHFTAAVLGNDLKRLDAAMFSR